MYAKHQNIYYAYGTLREPDVQVREIMCPFPKPLYLGMGFSPLPLVLLPDQHTQTQFIASVQEISEYQYSSDKYHS